ncbi:hypothetical protein ACFL6S_37665 [Candidatus Poribacteria bacterium]
MKTIKLRCPKCNSTRFIRKSTEEVEIIDRQGCIGDVLIDGAQRFDYTCAKCKAEVNVEEMVK